MRENYDCIVIGGGPGGYIATLRLAQNGLSVLCVDKREFPGGTCLHEGCIPSKILLHATKQLAIARERGREWGIHCEKLQFKLEQLRQKKEQQVHSLAKAVSLSVHKKGADFFCGRATLTSPQEVYLSSQKEERTVRAERAIILATGSHAKPLLFLPFDEEKILSSRGALALSCLPRKIAIVGGGAIGLEFALIYRRLESEVTLIETLGHLGGNCEQMVSCQLRSLMQKSGIQVHTHSQLTSAKIEGEEICVEYKKRTEEHSSHQERADRLLVSIGRTPHTEGLGVETLGVEKKPSGQICVDDGFQTTVPGIYAIGDLIDGPMLAHKASEEGLALADALVGKKRPVHYAAIPEVIYTDPECASVGLTEKECLQYELPFQKIEIPLRANSLAHALGCEGGACKLLAMKSTGELLGMHLVAPCASEMISLGTSALLHRHKVDDLARQIQAHPSISEITREAAFLFNEGGLHL